MAGRAKRTLGVLGNDPFLRAAAAPAGVHVAAKPPVAPAPPPAPKHAAKPPRAAKPPAAVKREPEKKGPPPRPRAVAAPRIPRAPEPPAPIEAVAPPAEPVGSLLPVRVVEAPTSEDSSHVRVGVVDDPGILDRFAGSPLGTVLQVGSALASRLASSSIAARVLAAASSGAAAVEGLLSAPSGPVQVDELGRDSDLVRRTSPLVDFLLDHYWRIKVTGVSELPKGPMLVIANHAGALPLDGPVLCAALQRELGEGKVRWLVEDALFHAPWIGTWLNRMGAVRACPENAFRLLESGHSVVVFPEGLSGLNKGYRNRYQLQRFGRGGFVKLALRAKVPMVPASVVGVEEAMPVTTSISAPRLGLPFIPITPTFPWFGPLGLIPRPVPWTIAFGESMGGAGHTPEEADDLALVQRMTDEMRTRISSGIRSIRMDA